MKRAVIIVAGGQGKRMGTTTPKQFLPIGGIPVLCRSVEVFLRYDPTISIFLVLSEQHLGIWARISAGYIPPNRYVIVQGGRERYYSVKNAINKITDDIDFVAIHDGVRPFVSVKTIANAFAETALKGNAVPCIAPPESIRISDNNGNYPINRNTVKLIQTPQVFETSILKKAYETPYNPSFTDDASVVENFGNTINLIEGERQNIKITTMEDLQYADYLCSKSH